MTATAVGSLDIGPRALPTAVIVLDESIDTDIDALMAELVDHCGTVTILITRHPPVPCVVAMGAGIDTAVMWFECSLDQEESQNLTARRLSRLSAALQAHGAGPVDAIDCLPPFRIFRSRLRREVDSVVRAVRNLRPDRVIVDERHHLCRELREAIAASPR